MVKPLFKEGDIVTSKYCGGRQYSIEHVDLSKSYYLMEDMTFPGIMLQTPFHSAHETCELEESPYTGETKDAADGNNRSDIKVGDMVSYKTMVGQIVSIREKEGRVNVVSKDKTTWSLPLHRVSKLHRWSWTMPA